MPPDSPSPSPVDRGALERQYGIPPDRFCGFSAEALSRAIVAHDGGPATPGRPVGYNPVGAPETRLQWLREAFGPDADVEMIRRRVQFFAGRVRDAIDVDWSLDDDAFDRAVVQGLDLRFPELSPEARAVIAGNWSYSHAR